jgi:hypothetical protein
MTIATNVTWASAIKNHPDFKKSTESIGSFASIIDNASFNAATCLRNLGNEPDPIIIFPSAIDQRPLAIHNIKDLGSTRINPDPIPFMIADFGSSPVAVVTFNPHALFRKTINPIAIQKPGGPPEAGLHQASLRPGEPPNSNSNSNSNPTTHHRPRD